MTQAAPPSPSRTEALSPDRYRLQLTIGGDTLQKLRLAKDLLRHAVPNGDEAEILDRALTALLAQLAKQKFAATDRPRSATTSEPQSSTPPLSKPRSRHIPAHVRRAVFRRDRGRCAFVAAGGKRCGERAFVELHHRQPFAHDGPATVDNIELRCRRHNAYEWDRLSNEVRTAEDEWLRRRLVLERPSVFATSPLALRSDPSP